MGESPKKAELTCARLFSLPHQLNAYPHRVFSERMELLVLYQKPLCVLQTFGEEKTLTMDFKASLPPGDYALWFCTNSFSGFTHADFTVG